MLAVILTMWHNGANLPGISVTMQQAHLWAFHVHICA